MKTKSNAERKVLFLIPFISLLQIVALSVILFCSDSFNTVASFFLAGTVACLAAIFIASCNWLTASEDSEPQRQLKEVIPFDEKCRTEKSV